MDTKNYGIKKNLIFIHKYMLEEYKYKYVFHEIIIAICKLFTMFAITYLPTFVIKLLNENSSEIRVLINLIVYFFVVYSILIMYKRLERNVDEKITMKRMCKGIDYYNHIIDTNFENIDISSNRALFNAGVDSYFDGFHVGFSKMLLDFTILIQSILGLIFYSLVISTINIKMAIILIIISALSIFANTFKKKWIVKNQDRWLKIDAKLKYLFTQSKSLENAKDIRLYNMKNWVIDTYTGLYALRKKWFRKEFTIDYLVNIFEHILTAIKYGLIYFIVIKELKSDLSVDSFVLLCSLILGVNNWIDQIFNSIKYLQSNNINVNNSRTILELDDNIENNQDTDKNFQDINLKEIYEIKLEHISFKFPGTDKKIFDDFNLVIKKGEKLALVGNNGAGKTTLVKLITGLYKPSEGKIYINGIDINEYRKIDYFKLFSVMFQDFRVLPHSIAENISCLNTKNIDFEKIERVLELSGLSDKINSLKNGCNSMMSKEFDEDGIILSGGEIQKLMLARALYKDSPVIILDEPTAALDAIAESEIYNKYNVLVNNKTSIFISHRLSSTKFCDRIIVLEHGKIVEEGNHSELLKKNKEYAKMFKFQSSYYKEGVI